MFALDTGEEPFYFRNASLFVFPLLAAYFVWERSGVASGLWLALPFAAEAVFPSVFPFPKGSATYSPTSAPEKCRLLWPRERCLVQPRFA